jgi:hypothetical protein
VYRWLKIPNISNKTQLRAIVDAAFRKEDDSGHAVQVSAFLQCCDASLDKPVSYHVHVIDYYCGKQCHVPRHTFSAELLANNDGADHMLLGPWGPWGAAQAMLAQIFHEPTNGPCTSIKTRQLRETSRWDTTIIVAGDAKSLVAAVTARHVKQPSDKPLWIHVQHLRELLDRHTTPSLWWLDTRDMVADGLIIGAVDRKTLDEIMNGLHTIQYPSEMWIAPDKPPGVQAMEQNDDTQRSPCASRRQQTYISNRLTRSLCFVS